ncbi:MAG: cyclase family protein, partial [Terriglobia bacterium]
KRLILPAVLLAAGILLGYRWHEWRVASPPGQFVMPKRIVDLSLTISEDLPLRRLGARAVQFLQFPAKTSFKKIVIDQPNLYVSDSVYELINHVGTHLDPANHMIKGALSADGYPLTKLIGRARVLDFRNKPRDEPITVADLKGKGIQPGDIVIVYTGYLPPTHDSEWPSYPYLSGEAAEWLAQLPIKAFASDMPSLGSFRRYPELMRTGKSPGELVPEHIAFLTREIPNIEGLTNLESLLGEPNVVFVGFPLKVKDSDGGLMRAAALVY